MSLAPTRLANFPEAVPDSAGIPESVRAEMLIAPFNDEAYLKSLLAEHGSEVAAVIIEPLQRIVPPEPGFLEAVRAECDRHGIVLIFDEVVTGFRVAYGGAQELYGVTPDLCTLGKVIGGGFPLAAIAGRADILAHFDQAAVGADKWLMQVGTLSGNPVAAAAGLKTMEILARPGAYEKLRTIGRSLMEMIGGRLDAAGIPHRISGDETLFDVVFTDRPIRNYRGRPYRRQGPERPLQRRAARQGRVQVAGQALPLPGGHRRGSGADRGGGDGGGGEPVTRVPARIRESVDGAGHGRLIAPRLT